MAVDGNVKDVWIVEEDLLRSVAMVNVLFRKPVNKMKHSSGFPSSIGSMIWMDVFIRNL